MNRFAKFLPSTLQPDETPLASDLDTDRAWRRTIKSRLLVAVIGVTSWTAVIEGRLVWFQLVQHAELVERAAVQQQEEVKAPARRGEIVDRNGNVLAFSVDADSIVAVPAEVKEPEATVRALCGVLECSKDEVDALTRKLSRKSAFTYVRRFVAPDEARRIAELELPGINSISETKRYYPKLSLASHVLGFVGIDNNGLGGIEQAYDKLIKGKDGLIRLQVDARQHAVQSRVELAPTAGASLELTIDQYVQHIAERELKRGVDETGAAGGTVIVMDPRTGEILALANYPTYNPNAFNRVPNPETRRNRAIQEIYEPGSTFKVVTAAAAIQEGVVAPSDLIDCAPGYILIDGRPPIDDVHKYGVLTFEDVIVKSSNVGAIRAGFRVGEQRLLDYVQRFGFGQRLAPDFPGQSGGIVWKKLDESAIASVSMGYQIGVTPLQMVTAVSSVANGGKLYEPHLVRATIRDGKRYPVAAKVLRQTVTQATANALTTIMEGVVERGTAKAAALDGYRVAGKTGTAAKILPAGGYSKSDYNGSFVGFVPSRKPALTILVVIDSARTGQGYGGAVAAPVFKRIAEATLRHLGVPRTVDPITPVFASIPAADAAPVAARTSILASLTPAANLGLMPDLRGLGAREALRVLGRLGLSARIEGSGVVVNQHPEAGAPLERGGWSVLRLGRQVLEAPR